MAVLKKGYFVFLVLAALGSAAQAQDASRCIDVAEARTGEDLFQRGKYEQALPHLSAAIASIPDKSLWIPDASPACGELKAQALAMRGDAYLGLGEPESAVADFTAALAALGLGPHSDLEARIFHGSALARQASGDLDGALFDLDMAISIQETGRRHALRGEVKLQSKDYAGAKADLGRALERGLPDTDQRAYVYRLRGDASAYLQDYDGAVADYTRVIDMADAAAPQRLAARLSRAIIHHMRRASVKAMADYDAVFSQLDQANEQTRMKAAAIVDGLKRAGLYNGNGEAYVPELRSALAQCVADPACRF
ncbi:MAG: tetratricopeptide repeat protein [Parvularculaceae bacterium]